MKPQMTPTDFLRRRAVLGAMAAGAVLATPWQRALGQTPPTVRLLVGYSAGGPVDTTARVIAPKLAELLGSTVVVDNKPGAGGLLAAQELARAKPDGATLWFAASPTITMSTHILKVPVHTLQDISAVAPVVQYHNLLVVNNSRPWKTLQELIAWAKENPGKFSFGSAGMGSSNHLAAELLAMRSGVQFTHIPYKGSAPAMADVIGGQIDGMFDITNQSKPQIDAGTVRALGMASPQRHPLLPDVPTMQESGIEGLKGFDVNGWMAVYAPNQLPESMLQRINTAVNAALDTPAIHERLTGMGHTLWKGAASLVQERATREHALWASVIESIKL